MEEKENVNVKLEDDFKPRKWLLVLLIIAMGAIIGVLIYNGINDYKAYEKKTKTEAKKMSESDSNKAKEKMDKIQEEVNKTIDKIDIQRFNGTIEMYSGTEYGNQVVNLLDEVITSNKKNKDNQISVTFNGQSSTEEETIRGYKKGLEDWTKYEVILDYDENGFVNKVEVRK